MKTATRLRNGDALAAWGGYRWKYRDQIKKVHRRLHYCRRCYIFLFIMECIYIYINVCIHNCKEREREYRLVVYRSGHSLWFLATLFSLGNDSWSGALCCAFDVTSQVEEVLHLGGTLVFLFCVVFLFFFFFAEPFQPERVRWVVLSASLGKIASGQLSLITWPIFDWQPAVGQQDD